MLYRTNYRVWADIGFAPSEMTQFSVVLDTGGGLNFIQGVLLPEGTELGEHGDVRILDENGKPLDIKGTINIAVKVGRAAGEVTFYDSERLKNDVILGWEYCDNYVEAIRPRMRLVELSDRTEVPIVLKHGGKS